MENRSSACTERCRPIKHKVVLVLKDSAGNVLDEHTFEGDATLHHHGIAMMSTGLIASPTCGNCRHWKPEPGFEGTGSCTLAEWDMMKKDSLPSLARCWGNAGCDFAWLETKSEFSCSQWAAQESSAE